MTISSKARIHFASRVVGVAHIRRLASAAVGVAEVRELLLSLADLARLRPEWLPGLVTVIVQPTAYGCEIRVHEGRPVAPVASLPALGLVVDLRAVEDAARAIFQELWPLVPRASAEGLILEAEPIERETCPDAIPTVPPPSSIPKRA